jgi:hypothetical protein
MGQAKKGSGGAGGKITDAQLAVDGKTGKYPEFRGNVATFYSNPVSKGGSANGHYGGNPETYMNVGDGMGKAMAERIVNSRAKKKAEKKTPAASKRPARPAVDRSAVEAEKLYRTARDAERMGQRGLARTFYKRVVARYPGTPAALKAAERLKKF